MVIKQIQADLKDHAQAMTTTHLKTLFRQSPERFQEFSLTTNSLLFDFSKVKMTSETLGLLEKLASHLALEEKRALSHPHPTPYPTETFTKIGLEQIGPVLTVTTARCMEHIDNLLKLK